MLRWRQIEVVDDVRNVSDPVLLRGRASSCSKSRISVALVCHVLLVTLASSRLVEVLLVHVLRAGKSSLPLVVGRNVGRGRLVQTASALESLVIRPICLWLGGLPLARAMLHLLILVPQANHMLLFRLLLAHVSLRCPWIN